jgi:hypothetical protein
VKCLLLLSNFNQCWNVGIVLYHLQPHQQGSIQTQHQDHGSPAKEALRHIKDYLALIHQVYTASSVSVGRYTSDRPGIQLR